MTTNHQLSRFLFLILRSFYFYHENNYTLHNCCNFSCLFFFKCVTARSRCRGSEITNDISLRLCCPVLHLRKIYHGNFQEFSFAVLITPYFDERFA